MSLFNNKMPSRPLPLLMQSDSDGFSYAQSGSNSPNHYHDIESLTLTIGRTRPGRKISKEKRQSTIWTESSEVEKTNTGNKKSKSKPVTNSKPKPKKKEKSSEKSSSIVPPTFLDNPLLQVDKNWTLPRVELWCRDPECVYNRCLWGSHYTNQHNIPTNFPGGAIPEVDEDTDEVSYHTDQTRSTGYYTRSSNDSSSSSGTSSQHHQVPIHSVPTMVLNPHRYNGTKGGSRTAREQMHLNMSMGINNFGSKDGITITHTNNTNSKADNIFTNSNSNVSRGKGNSSNNAMMTMTPMDTISSSISSNSNSNTDSTILTIHTETTTGTNSLELEESTTRSPSEGFAYLPGYDSTTSTNRYGAGSTGSSKPDDHDIVNQAAHRNNNGNHAQCVYSNQSTTSTGLYNQQSFRSTSTTPTNPYCPNCSGIVPLNHLDNGSEMGMGGRMKGEPGFWNFNKFHQHPLQRDHSFHSVGGFTLNGQYNTTVKKQTMVKFCSSHKISLVVSTFSLLVTIGLLITLFLMKKRGMMDTMMDS